MPPGFQLITSSTELQKLAEAIVTHDRAAFDLEADSMYHFQEKVCLLQVATENVHAIIDPLQIRDMSPLAPIFSSPDIRKIFHGADYDIRSLFRDYRFTIVNLFDTELACRFLGHKETGLNAVLKERFGIALDKRYQKRNWSKRPISEEMLDYAAADAAHLLPLAGILEKELVEVGRLHWVEEESEILSRARPQSLTATPLFTRFKGAGRLGRRNLAVLEALLRFRLEAAKKKDRPLFKIIGNDVLMDIVRRRPTDSDGLKEVKGLSKRQIQMYGSSILEAVDEALAIEADKLPLYPRKKAPRMNPETPNRIKRLRIWRDARARELKLNPSLLFSKAMLASIAVKNPSTLSQLKTVEDIRKWQVDTFGKEIIQALAKR